MSVTSQHESSHPVRVYLPQNGKIVECSIHRVTAENLRKMFKVCLQPYTLIVYYNCSILQVNPVDAWLREVFDSGTAYFPDQAGHFNLLYEEGTPVRSLTTHIVEGSTASGRIMVTGSLPSLSGGGSVERQSISSLPLPGPSASSSSGSPFFCSVVAKQSATHLIKVMKANMVTPTKRGGRPCCVCTGQTYLEFQMPQQT